MIAEICLARGLTIVQMGTRLLTGFCREACDPCFMDANQVGFVHEPTWEEIDNAISIKPRRQMSIQFSGGEPTLSPYFLDAIRYARQLGYISVQAATNGIEFAKSPEFCREAAEAGLRIAYLQFDGIGNAANSHRKVGNLFDVKLRAIENLHSAGVDVVPVTAIVNGINNEQVARILQLWTFGPQALVLFLGQSWIAFSLLEITNYIEHYGLTRKEIAPGQYEPVKPNHSWDSDRWLTNKMLFHLQRHSDHHLHPRKPYPALTLTEGAPRLPTGYAGMMLLALVPPLWRRVMDPRLGSPHPSTRMHMITFQ